MTNINCLKHCKFQTDGKCCCDNIILVIQDIGSSDDPECPYFVSTDKSVRD
ncbi:MAG: hypothetical protein II997_04190 [Clostridia bacterium]|nr:hypothetical protein [Clostridia bacterium]